MTLGHTYKQEMVLRKYTWLFNRQEKCARKTTSAHISCIYQSFMFFYLSNTEGNVGRCYEKQKAQIPHCHG